MFDLEIYQIVFILFFIIAFIFGFIAQQKQFCFSGSIKDYLQTKSTRRASSVIMAMIVAIISTQILVHFFNLDLSSSSYFKNNINYFAIILGGLLFGAGMMIADGCSSRSIVKFAQGDINALITLIFIAIFAFASTRGVLYQGVDFIVSNQFLVNISSYLENFILNIYFVLLVLCSLLMFLIKKIKRVLSLLDGVLIGLLVAFAWFVSAYIGLESFEREIQAQAISFVYPSAKTLEFITSYEISELSIGVCLVFGAIFGAYISSFFNKKYSFGCTSQITFNKLKYNIIGGSLMGIGGIMAIGCTVGQGLSGISTLLLSSFLAIISIFVGGYFTGKYLLKKDKLPMCFLFEWEDEKDNKPLNFEI
ncbi:YeeE/YedE family protein [Arcobacter porcinus]|uniref:Putative sulfur transporter n=1 Tax=Arcobacter porcinus TaxID=1935204 RepID=A0A5C2HKX4_9BACT|nr:YeeE/YedE family protein [Arcobacter porcinus]OCL86237.1 putative inner membrane protein [Arcobacter porcinus]OCL94214.1 putative inner membrane protein [Aliarcobacter thereius]QEP40918.1 putative sulfur transporter [Arcobacter porcinus]